MLRIGVELAEHNLASIERIFHLAQNMIEVFKLKARMKEIATGIATAKLDAVDLRILQQLQTDASLSNQELAATTHTSPATCLRRVKRLVADGVIERQVAVLSTDKLGAGLTAIVEVSLDRQGAEHLAAFEERALARKEVQQCYRVASGPDLILVLQVADMPAWHALVQGLFTQDANVRNLKTYFSVHRARFDTRVLLPTA